MGDVLLYADTIRSPEMRHEVPLSIPDPFMYAEHDGARYVVIASLESSRLEEELPELTVVPLEAVGIDQILRRGVSRDQAELEVHLNACRELGIRSATVPHYFSVGLADHLRANGIELRVDRELFVARRRLKNEVELAGIRRAQQGAQAAMAAVRDLLRRAEPSNGSVLLDGERLTCERLRAAVEHEFAMHGVWSDDFIVSHGAQTAIGHELGSGPIVPGEPIVVDIFPRDSESACFADMTRTFAVGTPPDELAEYHRLSRDALSRSIAAIRPGVAGSDVHRLVCDYFEQHGYPTQLSKAPGEVLQDGFFHGLGHGVGLEVHESPWLGRGGGELVAGDVVAVEPGLYRSGFGGCRLEDIVLVTEHGAEPLTEFPYDL